MINYNFEGYFLPYTHEYLLRIETHILAFNNVDNSEGSNGEYLKAYVVKK